MSSALITSVPSAFNRLQTAVLPEPAPSVTAILTINFSWTTIRQLCYGFMKHIIGKIKIKISRIHD